MFEFLRGEKSLIAKFESEVVKQEMIGYLAPHLITGGDYGTWARGRLDALVAQFVGDVVMSLERAVRVNGSLEGMGEISDVLHAEEELIKSLLDPKYPVLRKDRGEEVKVLCERAREVVIKAYRRASEG